MFKKKTKIFCMFFFISLFLNKLNLSALTTDSMENRLNKLEMDYGTKQVIIVSVKKESDYLAMLNTYEKINGYWKKVIPRMDAMVGKNGISDDKLEGDKKTPAGIFEISKVFGTASRPSGLKLPYTRTTKYDYWVDDSRSNDYNKLIHFEGNPSSRWNSFERLTLECYKYAIIVDYNVNPIVKGKGSAIFLHKYSSSKTGSLGCIEVSENNLMKILGWIDGNKHPVILMGTELFINEAIDSLYKEIKVILDGKTLNFDVKPIIVQGRTLVPVRGIFEALGMKLEWDGKTGRVTGTKEGMKVDLKIDEVEAVVNGSKKVMDVPAKLVNNRVLIPVRFISECFGANVSWDTQNNNVIIEMKKYLPNP